MARQNSSGLTPASHAVSPIALMGILAALLLGSCRSDRADDGAFAEVGLGSSEIEAVLDPLDPAVQGCLARARQVGYRGAGELVVSGTVGPDGRVEDAVVESMPRWDTPLEDCVLDRLELARFPASEGVSEFRYSWTLRSRAQGSSSEPPPAEAPRVFPEAVAGTDAERVRLEPEGIVQLAERDQGRILDCYGRILESTPGVGGDLEVSWAVDPSGAVRGAAVTGGSLDHAPARECVLRVVRTWQFAPVGGNTIRQASYSWNFVAEQEQEQEQG